FNLDSLVELKRQNDRRSAAQAILEGQATLAQILVLMPEQKIESLPNFWDLRTALGGQQDQMMVFGRAPLWLRESLIFPYLGGAEFVRWFDHEYPGKQPYGVLMPISTEQILHPARYVAGDRPDALAFESPGSDTVRYEDGLGECEIRLLLEQPLGDTSAAALFGTAWERDRHSQAAHRSGSALGAGRDRGAARHPAPPARGRRQLRSHDRVRGARARACGRGDRREIGEPRSAGREAGARRAGADAGCVGRGSGAQSRSAACCAPTVRTRRADGHPVGWAAGLGENHHRGEARAA